MDVNLSFCGCGFLGIYHVGVASCFNQYAPQLSMHKISGSSVGALVAMAHICGDLQLAYCTTDILTIAIEARSHTLGSFHPSFDIQAQVRESLERGLPEDAYLRANGKLHVSLTRVEDGENVIVSEFASNEDLIQVLLCSCFIPFWSGIRLPKYRGVAYIDGGFSNNLINLDDKTVTVSPFAGEADICPQDDTLNLLQINLSNTSFSISPSNLYRLSHALLPPEPEILSDLCKQGFADGIRYLQKMNLISCTKCIEIRSSLFFCNECVLVRQRALYDPLPKQYSDRIREASERVNKSLSKWVYSHRPVKYLSYLMVPYYVPIDLTLAIIYRFWKKLPIIKTELADCVNRLLEFLIVMLRRMQTRSTSAMLMGFGTSWEEDVLTYEKELIRQKQESTQVHHYHHHHHHHHNTTTTTTTATMTTAATGNNANHLHSSDHNNGISGNNNNNNSNSSSNSSTISVTSKQSTHLTTTTTTTSHRSRASSSSNSLIHASTGLAQHHHFSHKEPHSLEDTFDSIVDVTSKQEARIFAYYFRDAKNRLQVTEIFDLERASSQSGETISLNSAQSH